MDREWLGQPVSRLGLRPAVALLPAATLGQAIASMDHLRVGCVYRLDEHGRPMQQLTQLGVAGALAEGGSRDSAADAHLQPVVSAAWQHTSVGEVWAMLRAGAGEHLCLTGDAGEAVGMIDQTALIHALARALTPAGHEASGHDDQGNLKPGETIDDHG